MLRKISTPDFVALDTPAGSCLSAIKAIKPKKANRLFTTDRKKRLRSCNRSLAHTIYTFLDNLCMLFLVSLYHSLYAQNTHPKPILQFTSMMMSRG